jgi:predicted lipid-binding transport protein (Tim44 family)
MDNAQTKQAPMAVAVLVLGLVAVVFCWFMPYVAIPAGIIAIALYVVAKKKMKAEPGVNWGGKGMLTGGLVTGIIGLVIGVVFLIIALLFISAVAEAAGELSDPEVQRQMREALEEAGRNQ